MYVVANSVRGLLARKRSEEHLRSSNESKKAQQKQNKNDKKKGTLIKYTCQENIKGGHSIELGIVSVASHPIPSPDRNHAPKRILECILRTTTRLIPEIS